MHERLSTRLARILEADAVTGQLTLNQLLLRTEGRGIYLVMIILCIPFITPIPLPGVSQIVGAVIMVLSARLALALTPRLPRFLGERPLPIGLQRRILGGSVRLLRWIERFAKPRRTQWLGWPAARAANAMLIFLLAILLALPIPPVIPFSNFVPAFAIILLAVAMMEEDGMMIWIGYASSIGTVAYLGLSAGIIATFLTKLYNEFIQPGT